jgi:sigma-B regulation protein RsbU (phosphoserine phosphatase)
MTTVRALLRCRLSQPGSFSQVIGDVNCLLCRDTEVSGSFMTILCVMFDMSKRELKWVRAGHDPGLMYDPEDDTFRELTGKGIALGIDNACIYEENSMGNLKDGQIFFIGTDGVWEARNNAGEMFGRKRLMELIRRYAGATVDDMASAMMQAVKDFQNSAKQEDDITLVVIKVDQKSVQERIT